MPLQKQKVTYNFTKGVDTKTDSYQVSGKLLTLENGVFQTTGAVRKRNGYAQIGASVPLTAGNSISAFNNEIIATDGAHLSSYSQEQNGFVQKGNKVAVDLNKNIVVKNSYNQSYASSAYHSSGLKFFTYLDTASGTANTFNYSIIDAATGNSIVTEQLLVSGAGPVATLTLGNYFVFVYVPTSTTNINYIAIPISTLTPAAPVTVATDQFGPVAAISFASQIYVAYSTATPSINMFTLSNTLVKSAVTTVTENATGAISLGGDAVNTQVWCGYYNSSTFAVKYFVRSSTLTAVLAPTAIATEDGTVQNMTIVANNGIGRIYYAMSTIPLGFIGTGSLLVYYIKSASILNTTNTPTSSVLIRDCNVYSKAFYYSGDFYVGVHHDSYLQSTYFIINTQASVVTKMVPYYAGVMQFGFTTEVNQISSNVYSLCVVERDLIYSEAGVNRYDTGISEEVLTFNNPTSVQFIGNNLHVGGGIVSMYDGSGVCEHGFDLYPEGMTINALPYGGCLADTLANGQYQYKVTYDWTDNQGQIHQSATSVGLNLKTNSLVTFTGTTTSGSATISSVTFSSYGIMAGMAITGAGIAANTYVVAYSYASSTITLSANATATSSGVVTFTAGAQDVKPFTASPTNNGLQINPTAYTGTGPDTQYFYVIGTCTSGSTTMTVNDATNLRVGYYILNLRSAANQITAINGNVITVASAFAVSLTNSLVDVSKQISTYTATSGNNYFTVFPLSGETWPILPTSIVSGDVLYSTSFTPNYVNVVAVTAVSGPTAYKITISGTYNGGLTPFWKMYNASTYVQAGNTISGPGITGTANVKSVNTTTGVVTLDQTISAVTSGNYLIGNLYSAGINIPTLRITDKKPNPIVLSVWRTTLNGSTFQRVTTIENPIYNSTTTDYKVFTDKIADTTLTGDDFLYTTGGVVDNYAIPASNIMTSYRNRMMGVLQENPYTFWYSKQVIPGTPVAFNLNFLINVDQKGGPITGLATMDDKLIIFKQNLIFYMVGDGPTATGINNDFTSPQLISSDSGCINKKSIVITPVGTMYQSSKGIYLLDRALEVKYIGADVEAYNGVTVTSAALVANFNQVRLTLSNGVTLMYDYYFSQWSVFTNYNAVDSAVVNSVYTFINSSGVVNQETNNAYLDNGSYISLKVLTNWLSLAGLQGYERLYKMLLLGHYKSPHTLNFSVYYDFNETVFQSSSIPVSSDPGVYQFRLFFSRQKCEALKIMIQDVAGSTLGEGFQLSSVAFEAGIKEGLNKMAAANSYG